MEPVTLNNRYRLLELIGSGGMAVVYRGEDTLLQRQVAVKVLREVFASDPAFLARFQREAQAAANLDHSNIVTVYDVGQDGDRHYIVMEYVDGQDLKTMIRQKGRLGVDETLDITLQICAGVGHAHKASVVHCDVKPQNVLITQDGRAKVTDFGIARALSESGVTESETVWGSPLYFSPEQAAGEPPSPASDVYSVGVMMYEMLAGAPPFQAEKPAALALMHMREEPAPLTVRNPQVPPQLEWIVRKVLAKEPSARYRTAGQLAHVLEEYRRHSAQMTGQQPAVSGRPSATPAPQRYAADSEARAAPQAVPEWLTWVLSGIAFIAIAGLIPLWWFVYQAYSALPTLPPPPTSAPLVTLTPTVQLIQVPNVEGMKAEEAQSRLKRAGFSVAVEVQEREDVERGVVLEQNPGANELVPIDSEVSLVVSSPGRELTMPGVTGYSKETIQNGLESDGLHVVVEEVWSTQPKGVVVGQEPGPGATVHSGDSVTITVSGGVDMLIPLEANLDDLAILTGAELRQRTFQAGGTIALTLHWRALRSTDTHYIVFVHLIGPDGQLVAQQDVAPAQSTTTWRSGTEIADPHEVKIPTGRPAGPYQLRTGMYPSGQAGSRLPVVDAGLTTAETNSILIANIEIAP
jgi:serine/threonine-protein kinase